MSDYYLLLKIQIIICLIILLIGIWLLLPQHDIHYIGLNSTRINDSMCKYTWLGGRDYNSFIGDLKVNGTNIGHPMVGEIIHVGDCNATVEMYLKDTRTYELIHPKVKA